jgi:hypothetical protein
MRIKAVLFASVAFACIAPPGVAAAQPVAGDPPPPAAAAAPARSTAYDAAFFAQFAPRTALDIARRVPGFSLDLGNTDTRGFAGAAGNVVINGSRPSSKAESLEANLSRIPASRVIRVEVAPGDLYGSEYAGKSQVLNVLLSANAGIDANVTAAGRRWFTGYVNRDLSGSALIKRGSSSFNLSAGTGRNRQLEEGTDTLINVATGAEREFRRKTNSYFNKDPFASANWALERGSDDAFRVNARWAPSRFDLEQTNRVRVAGVERDDSLIQNYRNPVIELGGDVTRPLAGGAVKFVGLATRRKRDNLDAATIRNGLLEDGATTVGGFEQTQKAKQAETIARATWTHSDIAGFSVETGLEGVLNTLDSEVEFYSIGSGGARTRIDLPIDQATVKEKRGEAFVNVGRNLSPALRLDGGLAFEMSKLTVTGDTEAERSLKFLKPNIAIDWKPADGWHARLSVRRTVAQLNFYDFISVAELSADRVNAGNAELLPQRTWEVRATVDRRIFGDGLVKLDLGIDQVSMLQDQILTPEGFSAPGNLGTGKRRFISLNVDAPLASLGLTGTRLKLSGQLQRTRVHDPISGTVRNFSNFFPDWEWSAELRRDAGAFSYGGTIQDRDRFSFFRANEIDTQYNGGPFATAFVEYRVSPKSSITLDVENLISTKGLRQRLLFAPNRSQPNPATREFRERNRHPNIGLTFKQSFGGGGVAKTN